MYWGEEFGWTGYLRARLLPGRPLAAVLVTGLIWGVWHVPLAFLGYIEFSNNLVALPVWTVFFVLQQIPLSWLYLASKTVWVPSLAHAGNNMVIGLITEVLLVEHGDLDTVSVMFVLSVPLGIAALFMVRGRLLGRRASAESAHAHHTSTMAPTRDVVSSIR